MTEPQRRRQPCRRSYSRPPWMADLRSAAVPLL